jgi:hypothetical protein
LPLAEVNPTTAPTLMVPLPLIVSALVPPVAPIPPGRALALLSRNCPSLTVVVPV